MSTPSLLTVREVAEKLKMSLSSIYSLINTGKVASLRVGMNRGSIRIREADLDEYLESVKQGSKHTVAKMQHCKLPSTLRHIRLK